MPKLQSAACVLLVFTALASARAEDTYRWVDAEGGIHFGTEPPPGARNVRKVGGQSGSRPINVLPSDGGAAPAPATAAPAPATPLELAPAAGQLSPAEPTSIGGRSEDGWREEAQRLARRIESLEADVERADDERRSAYGVSSTAYYERKVARLEQQLETARSALEEFEDRARKLEVPPGWLR